MVTDETAIEDLLRVSPTAMRQRSTYWKTLLEQRDAELRAKKDRPVRSGERLTEVHPTQLVRFRDQIQPYDGLLKHHSEKSQ
jgi:hypothetical protein